MSALYDRVWKWSDVKKRKQLASAASRFLIAHDAGAGRAPLAYINYRYEEDEGHAVLYCYELQVARAAQGRGLGRMLMELAEQIAWGSGMSKLMLTVFSENTTAVAFYRKLGYDLDETSPDYCPGSSGGGSDGGGSSSAGSLAGGGSSAGSSGGSGSCSGGRSCASSFNGGSGSQTDSGDGGSGYHIMSKRAPRVALNAEQTGPEGLAPAAAQRQSGSLEDVVQQHLGPQPEEVREEQGRPDAPSQPESSKRQRMEAEGGRLWRVSPEEQEPGIVQGTECGGGASAAAAAISYPQPQARPSQLVQRQQRLPQDAGPRDPAREQPAQQPCGAMAKAAEQQSVGKRGEQLPLGQEQQWAQRPTDRGLGQQEPQPPQERRGALQQAAELREMMQLDHQQRQQPRPDLGLPMQRCEEQPAMLVRQSKQQQRTDQSLGGRRQEAAVAALDGPLTAVAAVASPGLLETEGDAAGLVRCVDLPGPSPIGRVAVRVAVRRERVNCDEDGRMLRATTEVGEDVELADAFESGRDAGAVA